MYINRGFIPSQRNGLIKTSFIKGLFSISTNAKHRISAVPETPEVMNAKEKDQRFLFTGSPIAERPPIKIKEPANKSQYLMS